VAALTAARYEIDLTRLRVPGAALLVGGALAAHLPEAWGLPCPLRATTGVPCPFCGTTTSVRDALGGHLGPAVAAAPLGLAVIVLAVLGVLQLGPARLRVPVVVLCGLLAAEWVFELHRFHVLL
jgi:hypothetical protein